MGIESMRFAQRVVGFVLLAGSATGSYAADQAAAGGADAGALEAIVVTAQRRTENLQDVPVAVTSFSAKELAAEQITSTLDIARYVPNFVALNNVGQASANVYYIRGLGQTQSFPTFEPQVGTYVDDIYLGRQNANNFALFSVDNIEVLRGPQGTLFGRNSTGGAVVVTLQKPAAAFGGDIDVGYGSFGRYFAHGYLDAPVSDVLRTRFAAFGVTDNGYVHDLTTNQTLNKTKDWGVREAIEFQPAGGNVDWNLSVDYADNNAANVLNFPGAGSTSNSGRIAYSGLSTGGGALSALTGAKGRLGQGVEVKSYGAMSNIKIGFDAGVLNVITGYRGVKQALAVDFPDSALGPIVPFDQVPYGQFGLAQEFTNKQYSQEFKWTASAGERITYTAGVFYLYETNNDDFGAVANLGPLFGLTSLPFPLGDETTVNDTKSGAAYAQGDIKLTDVLTLTAGGRFTHEVKTMTTTPNGKGGFDTAAIKAAGYLTDLTANEFTPRIALQYRVNPDLMYFASATRGFQGGGWNGLAFSAATFNNFSPETVMSYEAGLRSEEFDHRVRLNATLFYEDVKDYQLLSDLTTAASFVTQNAANMYAYGLEGELAWKPADALTLSLTLGLMNSAYYSPSKTIAAQQAACAAKPGVANGACGAGIVNLAGNLAVPSDSPHGTASLHASYDFTVADFSIVPNLGVHWVGNQNVGTEGLPAGEDRAYSTVDLGVSAKPNSMPLTVTLECKNCTMKNWGTAYLFGYKYYNLPGTWAAQVDYKF